MVYVDCKQPPSGLYRALLNKEGTITCLVDNHDCLFKDILHPDCRFSFQKIGTLVYPANFLGRWEPVAKISAKLGEWKTLTLRIFSKTAILALFTMLLSFIRLIWNAGWLLPHCTRPLAYYVGIATTILCIGKSCQ